VLADEVADKSFGTAAFLVVAVVHLPRILQPCVPRHTALIFVVGLLEHVAAQRGLPAQRVDHEAPLTLGKGPHVLSTPLLGSAASHIAARDSNTASIACDVLIRGAMIARGHQHCRASAVWCR
jgi:hypothetical protein